MYNSKKSKFILLITICLASLLTAEDDFSSIPKLIIEGKATLYKPADQLQLSLGVITRAADAKSALEDNNKKMQAVIAALVQAGLATSEYQTGNFSINPTYTPQPRDPGPDWRAEINGYEVANSIEIKTKQVEKAGAFIDAAGAAGANHVNAISFVLSDPEQERAGAISAATANAIKDAKALAEASQIQLKRILQISLDNPQPLHKGTFMMARAMDGGTPIAAGNVEVNATVSIIYEIQN